jgi:phosphoribosyl 1,2-cyclic phosphodiesterase
MVVKFWGTRGSVPVPGEGTQKYGGNTPCLEIISDSGEYVIIDAGTGIRELGNKIVEEKSFKKIVILLSHTHWDHIQGLPFFAPLYDEYFEVDIYSYSDNGYVLDHFIDAQMRPEFFPVNKAIFKAKVKYKKLSKDEIYNFGNLTFKLLTTHHSRGTLSFRIEQGKKSIVYMTDNEILYNSDVMDPQKEDIEIKNKEIIKFCNDADYLIHDTMYMLKDFSSRVGWGHSNNIAAAILTNLAKVKNLILFHYSPEYSDNMVEELINSTEKFISQNNFNINCIPSTEGLEIKL